MDHFGSREDDVAEFLGRRVLVKMDGRDHRGTLTGVRLVERGYMLATSLNPDPGFRAPQLTPVTVREPDGGLQFHLNPGVTIVISRPNSA